MPFLGFFAFEFYFSKMLAALNAPIDNRVNLPLYQEDDSSHTIYDSIPYTYFIQSLLEWRRKNRVK